MLRPLLRTMVSLVAGVCVVAGSNGEAATTYYVAPGGQGQGSLGDPFGRIQAAIDVAQPGDTVAVAPGSYAESLRTVRAGSVGAPITIRGSQPGSAVVRTGAATVLTVSHADVHIDGMVIDGDYGNFDTIVVGNAAARWVLRSSEVRRATKDCIDMAGPVDVLIERSQIHHCLNAAGGRTDAHGLAAGPVKNLTLRETEIHTFSGDAIQVDPGRSAPGWDNVVIERCSFWLGPLAAPENGFPIGAVPGENAIDTKTPATGTRARLVVRDTLAWGFRGGLIANMAAYNVKENVEARFERVSVWASEIAFRLRGPGARPGADVYIENAVIYDVASGVRYEDNLERAVIRHVTFGVGVDRPFVAAASVSTGLEVRNVLFAAAQKPAEGSHASNLLGPLTDFVDAAGHDYRLRPGAAAIDRGVSLAGVISDRDGVSRPQFAGSDVGAYEYCTACSQPPSAPVNLRVVIP